jgi:Ca2+-binding EF-hand superfamily protein
MFDKEKQGFIEIIDLQTIMRSLGRDPNEAVELLQSLEIKAANEDSNGQINFEDFLKLMKNLENRLLTNGG